MIKDLIIGLCLVLGSVFGFLAALGIVRLPDFYSRMQASTKAQTLALILVMFGLMLHFERLDVTTRSLVVLFFVFFTAPIGAHMIGRAAYLLRTPLWEGTVQDDLEGKYDYERRTLAGFAPPEEESDPPQS